MVIINFEKLKVEWLLQINEDYNHYRMGTKTENPQIFLISVYAKVISMKYSISTKLSLNPES